jgi:hypothetical protein
VDRATGEARCIGPGCGAYWGPAFLVHLAQVIEQQQAEREEQARNPAPPITPDVVVCVSDAVSTP